MKGEFAEKLEAAVKESGISVSKLSALSGLGRTAIQHVMSGDFLPTRAFLDKLLSCFPLPAEQHREITELYIMEKIGRKQYMSNIRIAQMLEDIPDFYRAELQAVNVSSTPISIKGAGGIITENGLMNVLTLCSHLFVDEIMREDPYMVITVPFSCKEYFNSLIHTMNGINKPIRIDHFGRFFTTDDSYLNFEKLSCALKFSLRPEIDYNPYYYYSKSTSGAQLNNLIIPYPYYIATRSYVILIGEDMNSAVMIHDDKIVSQVMEHTEELRNRSLPVYRMIS
ncbi:MAG: helix-turn-helix transcriptional regulator [Oscillospiraceae bacterium]|nr:helix-turn-helix transcriptional regulator [Oscillospiraceae bacterium]